MIKILYSLLISILLPGCFAFNSVYLPKIKGYRIRGSEEAFLQKKLLALSSEIFSFKGLSKIDLTYSGRSTSLRYAFVSRLPNKLRVEGFPINAGYSLSVLVSDNKQLKFVDHVNKEVILSESSKESMQKLTYVPLDPKHLTHYVLGVMPINLINDDYKDFDFYFDEKNKIYSLTDKSGNYWNLNSNNLRLNEVQIRTHPDESAALTMNYKYVGNNLSPSEINFYVPEYDLNLKLTNRMSKLNEVVDDKFFSVFLPADYALKIFTTKN